MLIPGKARVVPSSSSLDRTDRTDRSDLIVSVLDDAFAPLMEADPVAFRGKYRKMAADPHAFYRGSACLFYADVTAGEDPFCDERSGRIWIHGDLHVENFGTYLNSDGVMVFDINDFDEAYLGRFTWDLQRFAASLALTGWQKALPEDDVRALIGKYLRAYLAQVDEYRKSEDDDFALHLDNTDGPIHDALVTARHQRRADLLDRPPSWSTGSGPCVRTAASGGWAGGSGPRWSRPSRATSRRSRRTSGSTVSCSTTCTTWPGSRASASAAPGCRPTTCSSRATARRWTTTCCCR